MDGCAGACAFCLDYFLYYALVTPALFLFHNLFFSSILVSRFHRNYRPIF
jgi:hypothetical protein